jgi:hypothetical protein
MADNLLKQKAMGNYWRGMGWYTGNMAGEIVGSAENNEVSKHQKPNFRKKFVKVGKSKMRIKGM